MSIPIPNTDPTDRPFHPSLEETAALAGHWHAGQLDHAGVPYVRHLMRVSRHLSRLFPEASMAERHAAWLHDVVEDTGITTDDLAGHGYAPEVIEIVVAVTKPPNDPRSYAERIEDLAASGQVAAMRVKIADLTDNADPARLAALPEDRAASLGKRYRAALQRLTEALERHGQAVLDEDDPDAIDHVPLSLAIEPVDYWTLTEAARLADRSVEAFVLEEAISLAHRIVLTGSLHHVTLARDRTAKDTRSMAAFRAAGADAASIADQAIEGVAHGLGYEAEAEALPVNDPGKRPKRSR